MPHQVKAVVARAPGAPATLETVTVPDPGPDVTDVAEGDFVILNWRAVCGSCLACRFVSETIDLTDVQGAFDRMSRGEVLRSVVRL